MTTIKTSGNAAAYRVFVGLAPHELPLSITRSYDFSSATTYQEDLSAAQENGYIEWIQAVYIDNSLNGSSLTVVFPVTGQNITIAPYQQGFFPILAVNPPKLTLSTQGGVLVNVCYLNFAVSANIWDSQIKPIQLVGMNGTGTQSLTNPAISNESYQYSAISATTQIKSTSGLAGGIFVSSVSGSPTITVYDDTASGTTHTLIASFTPSAGVAYPIPANFTRGLNVVISGTCSCTVFYQ